MLRGARSAEREMYCCRQAPCPGDILGACWGVSLEWFPGSDACIRTPISPRSLEAHI